MRITAPFCTSLVWDYICHKMGFNSLLAFRGYLVKSGDNWLLERYRYHDPEYAVFSIYNTFAFVFLDSISDI